MCETFRWKKVCFIQKDLSKIIQKIFVLKQCDRSHEYIGTFCRKMWQIWQQRGVCQSSCDFGVWRDCAWHCCNAATTNSVLYSAHLRPCIGTAVIQLLPTVCSIQHTSDRVFLLLNVWKSTEKVFVCGNASAYCLRGHQFAARSGHCLFDWIIPD